MPDALSISGDVSTAGAALAGLLLVFMGSISTSFESYQPTERKSVRGRFQFRVWFAFAGFGLAVLASILGLFAKWLQIECVAITAMILLVLSFGWVVAAALRAALDVK